MEYSLLTYLRNKLLNKRRYREDSEAVIISCFFNPQESAYRKKAFDTFYKDIKHLDHLIIECVIGNSKPQLASSKNTIHVNTENLLWHKEALLNLAVKRLHKKYKYVFWVDADVVFDNLNWLTASVKEFKRGCRILQPFEHCVHLKQDVDAHLAAKMGGNGVNDGVWRSFCANAVDAPSCHQSEDYNTHGHVGFAWGATREVLEAVPLYDKALIGGADHIIAHAAAGQIPNKCIDKSFTDDLDAVYKWSRDFYKVVDGRIGYTKGNLYHIWHGDISKREYLKRIQEFTPETKDITEKDANGLYVTKKGDSPYIQKYFDKREVKGGCGRGCSHTHDHHYYTYGSNSPIGGRVAGSSGSASSAGYDGDSNASSGSTVTNIFS